MRVGYKRTLIARGVASLGFLSGLIGLVAAFTDHTWKLSPFGWWLWGILLTLIAIFVLVDGAIAYQKARVAPRSIDD